MKKLLNKLLRFTDSLIRTCRRARIPCFSCKKSKKTYKQYQHIALLGIMKYTRSTYRTVIELIELMPKVLNVVGLERIPHFTTLQKFLQRFERRFFDRLLSRSIDLFNVGRCMLAIDMTGFSSPYMSRYYSYRTRTWRKKFFYSGAAVDTKNQIVLYEH